MLILLTQNSVMAQDGEIIYVVEPSAATRYPDAPHPAAATTTDPIMVQQTKVPSGWHLQIITNAKSLEEAATLADQNRGLFSGLGLYVIVSGETYRLSVGPIVPSRLQSILATARGAGYSNAVLRRLN